MISYKILTLFPEFFETYTKNSPHFRRGVEKEILQLETIQLRKYGKGNYAKVDDTLYGGGPGLLLKPDVVVEAIEDNCSKDTLVILLDPKGEIYSQELAQEFSKLPEILFVCGRYEGFDARVREIIKPRVVSIGDYILSNGDIAALTILDSLIRLQKGTCHDDRSAEDESFSQGWLEYDQYTHPSNFRGYEVPPVLLEGNHKKIEEWKRKSSLKNSIKIRPELLKRVNLSDVSYKIFKDTIKELWDENEHR